MSIRTCSLSRGLASLVKGTGYIGEGRQAREERVKARDYLMGHMRLPGGTMSALAMNVEREIDQMQLAERVMLEMEMDRNSDRHHSYDYDPMNRR